MTGSSLFKSVGLKHNWTRSIASLINVVVCMHGACMSCLQPATQSSTVTLNCCNKQLSQKFAIELKTMSEHGRRRRRCSCCGEVGHDRRSCTMSDGAIETRWDRHHVCIHVLHGCMCDANTMKVWAQFTGRPMSMSDDSSYDSQGVAGVGCLGTTSGTALRAVKWSSTCAQYVVVQGTQLRAVCGPLAVCLLRHGRRNHFKHLRQRKM